LTDIQTLKCQIIT